MRQSAALASEVMAHLDDNPTTPWEATIGTVRVRFGAGRLAELGRAAAALGVRRPLLVSDDGVRRAGHLETAARALDAAGLETAVWDGVVENPTSGDVSRGAAAATAHRADGLVAVGGGSVMDCARGINFIHTNGGTMADYRGYGKATRPLLPSLAAPTTAGTGSEAQSYAVIADPMTRVKMACGDPSAAFRVVILDPDLPATVPPAVAATAGLDALSHAVESAVSTRRNPISELYAREAWRRLEGTLESVLGGAATPAHWARLLVGAHLAGAAIEQSMLGAAHAAANPLTARYGVVHGAAVLLMLPAVVRFNGESAAALYQRLAGGGAGADGVEALAWRLEALRAAAGLPARLRDAGVERAALGELARQAAAQWTGRFNPRPAAEADYRRLYEATF